MIEKFLHIFQLKDYSCARYIKHIKQKLIFTLFFLFVFAIELIFKNIILTLCLNAAVLIINLAICSNIIKTCKTPLIYTGKIKRLYILSSIVLAIPSFFYLGGIVGIILLYFIPIIANFLNFYDKILNKKFIRMAQKKLDDSKAKIIAITGSNGKTSVKNILCEMLSEYNVLASPKSYNTPLGIAKFINESKIKNCDFLILEYGARHLGDIKKMCKLFGADYGIITLVAPQHLESFKTIDNVYKTKKELTDFLQTKPCVYNLDNIYTYKMFCEKLGTKIGVSLYQNSSINCTDYNIKLGKTYFKITLNGKTYSTSCKLLGKHNILNILLSAAMAKFLNVSDEHVLKTIKHLDYIPHRLQLIKTNINILDDSYNCSLSSATEALEVLQYFPGKKVVVTPGIIEGGDKEFEINYELGTKLAVCNEVIIIGEHNKNALTKGLQAKKFKKIVCFNSLEDAKKHFVKLNKNDNLLLLNDLPDDYK